MLTKIMRTSYVIYSTDRTNVRKCSSWYKKWKPKHGMQPPSPHTHTHIGQRVNECFHQYTAHYHFVSILDEIKCHLIFFHDVSVIIQRMQVILLNSLSINKNYSPTGSYFSPILLKIRIMFCSLGAFLKWRRVSEAVL